jgi:5-methyltetrahydrofolate--homocysteine methyltransferase
MGGYDETPEQMYGHLREFATSGFINMAGGCCGTTNEHIAAIARACDGVKPRIPAAPSTLLRLSGLEPLYFTKDIPFVNVGERCNIAGSRAFKNMILKNEYERALQVARDQVDNGAQVLDINMDEGLLDGVAAMGKFTRLIVTDPDISKVPLMIDSSKFAVIEVGLENVQGKVNAHDTRRRRCSARCCSSALPAPACLPAFALQPPLDTLKAEQHNEACASLALAV